MNSFPIWKKTPPCLGSALPLWNFWQWRTYTLFYFHLIANIFYRYQHTLHTKILLHEWILFLLIITLFNTQFNAILKNVIDRASHCRTPAEIGNLCLLTPIICALLLFSAIWSNVINFVGKVIIILSRKNKIKPYQTLIRSVIKSSV